MLTMSASFHMLSLAAYGSCPSVHLRWIQVASAVCMQIQEIVNTGKLSKLEHFETDEKV